MKKKLGFTVAAAAVMLAGCASMAVTKDSLTQRTSLALGIPASQFTISNRSDSGVRTDYNVTTSSGKHYACYVTGTFSVTGRVVSDAMCTQMAGAGTASKAQSNESSSARKCNALLKAAGKCE